ncbi:MAG: BMP family protein [Butyricicoccus sp.]
MKSKRIAAFVTTAALTVSMLTGCGGSTASQGTASSAAASGSGAAADGLKVAAIFGGPITDKSWNETAYNGLMAIEQMGAETSYVENVEASAAPDAIRTFASSGFNVVYVNSSAFKDAAYEIAPEFPDVTFIINGVGEQGDNYASLTTANQEQGYIQGLLCAVASENGKIGMICGTEMTPTLDCEAGFYQAIAYVNENLGKNVESRVTYLGNYTDTSAGYETAMSFIAEGYDVMTTVADNASNAVLQACEEKGVLCVGNGIGQNEVAPTKLIAGVKKDNEPTYVESFNQYLDGTLFDKAGSESFGVNYGVVALDGYYDAASCYTDEEKQFIEETMNKIASGEIDVLSMAEYKEAKGA